MIGPGEMSLKAAGYECYDLWQTLGTWDIRDTMPLDLLYLGPTCLCGVLPDLDISSIFDICDERVTEDSQY